MKKENKIRVGKKIEEIRKAKGLTLVRLSDLSGIQVATLSRIENNKMTGTLETHVKLIKVLGVTLAELYADIDQSNEQQPSSGFQP